MLRGIQSLKNGGLLSKRMESNMNLESLKIKIKLYKLD
nr:MAG TPA: hypothetical protein [Caudoviricetes sp.]